MGPEFESARGKKDWIDRMGCDPWADLPGECAASTPTKPETSFEPPELSLVERACKINGGKEC